MYIVYDQKTEASCVAKSKKYNVYRPFTLLSSDKSSNCNIYCLFTQLKCQKVKLKQTAK